jgi:hypothetical protein
MWTKSTPRESKEVRTSRPTPDPVPRRPARARPTLWSTPGSPEAAQSRPIPGPGKAPANPEPHPACHPYRRTSTPPPGSSPSDSPVESPSNTRRMERYEHPQRASPQTAGSVRQTRQTHDSHILLCRYLPFRRFLPTLILTRWKWQAQLKRGYRCSCSTIYRWCDDG